MIREVLTGTRTFCWQKPLSCFLFLTAVHFHLYDLYSFSKFVKSEKFVKIRKCSIQARGSLTKIFIHNCLFGLKLKLKINLNVMKIEWLRSTSKRSFDIFVHIQMVNIIEGYSRFD